MLNDKMLKLFPERILYNNNLKPLNIRVFFIFLGSCHGSYIFGILVLESQQFSKSLKTIDYPKDVFPNYRILDLRVLREFC